MSGDRPAASAAMTRLAPQTAGLLSTLAALLVPS